MDVPFDKPARSPRNGRLPMHVEQQQMEKASASRRKRMAVARVALSSELGTQFPDSLAKLRLSRGMSQTQLAEAIGTSQPHIAKIEAGALQLFWSTAIKIADALAVSLDELRPLLATSKADPSSRKTIVSAL
jgi:ribosome-binding protein aMBF1 (putative translation factor)